MGSRTVSNPHPRITPTDKFAPTLFPSGRTWQHDVPVAAGYTHYAPHPAVHPHSISLSLALIAAEVVSLPSLPPSLSSSSPSPPAFLPAPGVLPTSFKFVVLILLIQGRMGFMHRSDCFRLLTLSGLQLTYICIICFDQQRRLYRGCAHLNILTITLFAVLLKSLNWIQMSHERIERLSMTPVYILTNAASNSAIQQTKTVSLQACGRRRLSVDWSHGEYLCKLQPPRAPLSLVGPF